VTFAVAKTLLYAGVPVVHVTHGRLFPLPEKESIFAKISAVHYTKFFLKNQHLTFAVNLLPNSDDAQLVYLPLYEDSIGWEICTNTGGGK